MVSVTISQGQQPCFRAPARRQGTTACLSAPEMAVLVAGLRVLGVSNDNHGVLTEECRHVEQ